MPTDHTSNIPDLTGARLKGKNGHTYSFKTKIGAGQFGVVYRCISEESSQLFACKVMNMQSLKDCLKVVLREVEILMSLHHERLLSCAEQLCAGDFMFLFTPFIPGGTLADKLVLDLMPIGEIGRIVYQVLEGVKYLHEHNISHRDLKPENILCTEGTPFDIVIADFGLSRTYGPDSLMTSNCGSSAYAAPEVFASSYTNACDMWSIGIIVNEMIRGPFSVTPRFSLEYNETVPEVVRNFVSKLLERDPEKRMSAQQALAHEWMVQIRNKYYSGTPPTVQADDADNMC